MPPKKKEEELVEEPPKPVVKNLERIRQNALRCEEGEMICHNIIQEVMQKAEDQMLRNYFDRTAIPYTVQCVCKEMLDLVQFVFVARDSGDVGDEAAMSWEQDEEPEPCPTDTWARGAVPVRKKSPHTAVVEQKRGVTPPKKREEKDIRRRPSSRDAPDKSATLTSSDAVSKSSQRIITPTASKKVHPAAAGRRGTATGLPTAEEEEELQGQRGEHKRRQEIQEAVERQHQMIREVRGAEYVVDSHHGKVIPVKPLDPKRLPSKKLELRFHVEEEGGTHTQPQEEQRPRQPAVTSPANKASPKKRTKKDDKNKWSEFVQPEDTFGPMVAGMNPSGGVTVKEGDVVKRAEMKNPKTKMSRNEYKKMTDVLGIREQQIQNMETVETPKPPPKAPPQKRESTKGLKPAAGSGPAAVNQQQLQQQQQQQQTPATAKQPGQQTAKAKAAQPTTTSPADTKPQPVAPVPANKHTAKSVLGDRPRYPRDRKPGSPREADTTRVHPLPAPLFPGTQGHGTVVGSLAKSNPYALEESPPRARPQGGDRIRRNSEALGDDVAEDFLRSLTHTYQQ